MFDVNPLGPLAHLKEVERRALALQSAAGKNRPWIFAIALAWAIRLPKRVSISPASEDPGAGSSVRLGRR